LCLHVCVSLFLIPVTPSQVQQLGHAGCGRQPLKLPQEKASFQEAEWDFPVAYRRDPHPELGDPPKSMPSTSLPELSHYRIVPKPS
jgi:hypothetical protein